MQFMACAGVIVCDKCETVSAPATSVTSANDLHYMGAGCAGPARAVRHSYQLHLCMSAISLPDIIPSSIMWVHGSCVCNSVP
jgi:hypothetical protein